MPVEDHRDLREYLVGLLEGFHVRVAADGLARHLSLLFVPVGVGVIVHAGLIAQYGVRMLAAVLLSTWLALAVAALVLRACLPRSPAGTDEAAR